MIYCDHGEESFILNAQCRHNMPVRVIIANAAVRISVFHAPTVLLQGLNFTVYKIPFLRYNYIMDIVIKQTQHELYQVNIADLFEGPMDLLVYLIKKNEIDIYDIPIGLLTAQYMEYLEIIKVLDIDSVGEFILMASILAHIKSRMLLPYYNAEQDEDPRMEIVRPLEEYLRLKAASEQLLQRDMLYETSFVRPVTAETGIVPADRDMELSLYDLMLAFQNLINKLPDRDKLQFTQDSVSVRERITQILDMLESRDSLTFDELIPTVFWKADIVVNFLAILEMAKLALVKITQNTQSGIIRIFAQ